MMITRRDPTQRVSCDGLLEPSPPPSLLVHANPCGAHPGVPKKKRKVALLPGNFPPDQMPDPTHPARKLRGFPLTVHQNEETRGVHGWVK